MKPRNKFEKNIFALKDKLKDIPHEKLIDIFEKKIGYRGRVNKDHSVTCTACNQRFHIEGLFEEQQTCPHCGQKVNCYHTSQTTWNGTEWINISYAFHGMQLVREYAVDYFFSTTDKPKLSIWEVERFWYGTKGQLAYEAMPLMQLAAFRKNPFLHGEISFKRKQYNASMRNTYIISIIPEFRKMGLNVNTIHSFGSGSIFYEILNPHVETLIKSGKAGMEFLVKRIDRIDNYFQQFKLLLRNHYSIAGNVDMWCDYIDLIRYFGLDDHNPHYVCPADLKAEHDRLLAKKNKLLAEEERKKSILTLERTLMEKKYWVKKYPKMKKNFLNLSFSDDKGFIIEPLKTLEEFYLTGKTQNICVFTQEYYKEKSSLILNAKTNESILATIEVNLDTLSIVQVRGKFNQVPHLNQEIRDCITAHMNDIARCAKIK